MSYVKFWLNITIGLGLLILYVYLRALRERRTGELVIPEFNKYIFILSLIGIIITGIGLFMFVRGWFRDTTKKNYPQIVYFSGYSIKPLLY